VGLADPVLPRARLAVAFLVHFGAIVKTCG
jgi:hypothetical protein